MRLLLLLLTTVLFFSTSSNSSGQGSGRWRLVWADEFDYNGLPDREKWSYDVGGHGWGNKELQFYTERRKENARVENGSLVIEARREPHANPNYQPGSSDMANRAMSSFA